jgi:hypothetical protein
MIVWVSVPGNNLMKMLGRTGLRCMVDTQGLPSRVSAGICPFHTASRNVQCSVRSTSVRTVHVP